MDPAPPELMKYIHHSCQKCRCGRNQCSCRASGVSCTDLCGCVECVNDGTTENESILIQDDSDNDEYDSEWIRYSYVIKCHHRMG